MRNSIHAKIVRLAPGDEKKPLDSDGKSRISRPAEDKTGGKIKRTTISWARSIPSEIRPRSLVINFPRIANTLADAWPYPLVFEARLKDLMLDSRGGRQGFPFDVLQELSDLRNYFDRTKKSKNKDIWTSVRDR